MDDYLTVHVNDLTFVADRAILTAFPYLNAVFTRQGQLDRDNALLDLTKFISTPLQLHRHFHVLVPERDLLLLCAWVTARDVKPLLRVNDDVTYWTQLSRYLGNAIALPRDLRREAARRKWGRRWREGGRFVRRGWAKAWNLPRKVHQHFAQLGITGAQFFTVVRLFVGMIVVATAALMVMLAVAVILAMHGKFIVGLVGMLVMYFVELVVIVATIPFRILAVALKLGAGHACTDQDFEDLLRIIPDSSLDTYITNYTYG